MKFSEHRQDKIMDVLLDVERVSVQDLAEKFEVSAESIRRDLRELERRGKARRVYGGAVLNQQTGDQEFGERKRVNAREKARIGEAAAALVESGTKIFLGSGTTALSCVKHLAAHKDLTIVTNSISAATHFFGNENVKLRILGGAMQPNYHATYGHATVSALQDYSFDLAILGTSGIHLERGFMVYEEEEAAVHRAALASAAKTVIIADSTKFGKQGLIRAFGLDEVDAVVTSKQAPKEFRKRITDAGITYIAV